jgi:hypothetical protein
MNLAPKIDIQRTFLSLLVICLIFLSGTLAFQGRNNKTTIDKYIEDTRQHIQYTDSLLNVVYKIEKESKSLADSARGRGQVIDSLRQRVQGISTTIATRNVQLRSLKDSLAKISTVQDSLTATISIIDIQNDLISKKDSIISVQDKSLTIEADRNRQLLRAYQLQSIASDSLQKIINTIPRLKNNPDRIFFNKIPLPSRSTSFVLGVATGITGAYVISQHAR